MECFIRTAALFQNKDKIDRDIQSNVVYLYNCDQCSGQKYVGESVRHFITRKREHIKGDKGETEVYTHIHQAKESNFSIVTVTKHTTIGESLVYHSIPPRFRLNKYHPPYALQLFTCDTDENDPVINSSISWSFFVPLSVMFISTVLLMCCFNSKQTIFIYSPAFLSF